MKKVLSVFVAALMVASVFTGCSKKADKAAVTEFTYFITMPGSEKNDDNEIAKIIAEKTGVKVKEVWLTGQTAAEATGTLVASGEYPDMIDSDDMSMLVDSGALIALDDYINKYPQFRDTYFTKDEWEKFKIDFDIVFSKYLDNSYEKYSKIKYVFFLHIKICIDLFYHILSMISVNVYIYAAIGIYCSFCCPKIVLVVVKHHK